MPRVFPEPLLLTQSPATGFASSPRPARAHFLRPFPPPRHRPFLGVGKLDIYVTDTHSFYFFFLNPTCTMKGIGVDFPDLTKSPSHCTAGERLLVLHTFSVLSHTRSDQEAKSAGWPVAKPQELWVGKASRWPGLEDCSAPEG